MQYDYVSLLSGSAPVPLLAGGHDVPWCVAAPQDSAWGALRHGRCTMNATSTASAPVRWGRVAAAGVLAPILSMIVVFLVITAYAARLAIQARGQPDAAQITQFANQFAPWAGPLLTILLVLGGATAVARTVRARAHLHGVLVGLVAALCVLLLDLAFAHGLQPAALLASVLTIGAGWLGGMAGGSGAASTDSPNRQASK